MTAPVEAGLPYWSEDMSAEAEPKINPRLWQAIEQRRLIRLVYKRRERIVEPHDYGIHNGIVKLFAY